MAKSVNLVETHDGFLCITEIVCMFLSGYFNDRGAVQTAIYSYCCVIEHSWQRSIMDTTLSDDKTSIQKFRNLQIEQGQYSAPWHVVPKILNLPTHALFLNAIRQILGGLLYFYIMSYLLVYHNVLLSTVFFCLWCYNTHLYKQWYSINFIAG